MACAPLAQRASSLALHSSLFVPYGAVNYDYIVTNSISSLLILLAQNVMNTLTIIRSIWPTLQNLSKPLVIIIMKGT